MSPHTDSGGAGGHPRLESALREPTEVSVDKAHAATVAPGSPSGVNAAQEVPGSVVGLHDGIVEGACWPLVPDGLYLATYVDHEVVELRQFGGAPRCFIRFKLTEAGEHSGKILYRAYRVKARIDRRRFRASRKSDLTKMAARVLYAGSRLSRFDRISLRELKPMMLRVSTRTVTKDPRGRPLPLIMHYSVVDDVVPE